MERMLSLNKTRMYVGILLVVLGVMALLGSFTNLDDGKLFGTGFMIVIGALLFVAYAQTRKIGFLIPACNVLALGGFIALTLIPGFEQQGNLAGAVFFATQGLAFGAVYLFGIRKPWPLIVSLWTLLFAVFVGAFTEAPFSGAMTGAAFFVLMGLGFMALRLCGVRGMWTVYTGLAVIAFGAFISVVGGDFLEFRSAHLIRRLLIPVVLVIVGFSLMFRRKAPTE